jgi:hypothetical protein
LFDNGTKGDDDDDDDKAIQNLILLIFQIYSADTLLVAQLVEALRYKPEGRVFDSRWC